MFLSACGGSDDGDQNASSEKPVIGGDLVDATTFATGAPFHTDPAQSADIYTSQLVNLLYDGLTSVSPEGTIEPSVAEEFSSNDDATVWTFKLRDDVKFTDGSPVLPSSFKLGWQRAVNPKLESESVYLFAGILMSEDDTELDNVVADDDARTLTVTLPNTDRDLPALLTLVNFSPVPASVGLDDNLDNKPMIGNGPFVLNESIDGESPFKITRNETYYGGAAKHKAYLNSVQFRITDDVTAAYNDFAAGSAQVATFPGTASADLEKYQSEDIINTPTLGIELWGFNWEDSVVGGEENVKLRQAISKAINKKQINEEAYGGTHPIASQFSSPTTPGSDAEPASGEPDVDGAKKLLAEWGKTPPEIKVSFNSGASHDRKAEIIVENLKAVGIPAVLDPQDLDSYRSNIGDGKVQFFRYAWVADFPAYRSMIEPPFATSSIGLGGNLFRYTNADVDKFFEDAQDKSSIDDRNADYRDAEKQIMADLPIVPIDWTTASFIKVPEVRNLQVSQDGQIFYDNLWIDPSKA